MWKFTDDYSHQLSLPFATGVTIPTGWFVGLLKAKLPAKTLLAAGDVMEATAAWYGAWQNALLNQMQQLNHGVPGVLLSAGMINRVADGEVSFGPGDGTGEIITGWGWGFYYSAGPRVFMGAEDFPFPVVVASGKTLTLAGCFRGLGCRSYYSSLTVA